MPSVPSTVRVALREDVVPLSKSYKTADGKGTFNSVVIPKGHELFIPLNVIQLSKDIWGEDADQFNPDRWDNLPETVRHMPGVWGNLLTFLAGARSCIGYRFALVEYVHLSFPPSHPFVLCTLDT